MIGSEFEEAADTVVIAIGYKVDKLLFQTTPGLEATDWGTVAAGEGGSVQSGSAPVGASDAGATRRTMASASRIERVRRAISAHF